MTSIAFLGLGTMGQGMVRNLLRAGHDVVVWNRSPAPVATMTEAGARAADTIGNAVAEVDVVLYCLADDTAVRDVVLAADGLAQAVRSGTLVIDLSTISAAASRDARDAVEANGARFLDAPVFGSKGEAAAAGLWVVVGGDRGDYEEALPVLSSISATTHYMGAAGSGVGMKLVGNLVVASQLLALGQALVLAKKSGLQLADVLGVLAVTDFRSPIFDGVGAAVLDGDYSPSFALKLMQKDARLIQDAAAEAGAPVPSADSALTYIDASMQAGRAEENASALIKAVAEEAGVTLP